MGNEKKYLDIHADRNKIKLLIAGGASGLFSKTVMAPISRVAILFQVQKLPTAQIPELYTKSVFSALKQTYINEGILGFWRGNGTHAIKKVPFSAIKFLSYERYKQILTPIDKQLPTTSVRLLAGGFAAATAVTLTYPLDLVQTQLTIQTTKQNYKGIYGTMKRIYIEEGFRQLYRGLFMGLLSVVPYMSLNMTIWESLKQKAVSYNQGQNSLIISAVSGAISGSVASSIIYPIELLKRHMQLNHRNGVYTNYKDAIKQIYRIDGIRGFYRGLLPHFYTVIPSVALGLTTYDLMKLLLKID